jgi:N-acetylmuramoyl-L-alanine amidase
MKARSHPFLTLLFLLVILQYPCWGQENLSSSKVFLDPGHGGKDLGARGPKGLTEKVVVLEVAQSLKYILEQRLKIEVFLTRSGDYYLSLPERISLANNREANLFLSLHAGAAFNTEKQGFNIFYLKDFWGEMETLGSHQDFPQIMSPWLKGSDNFLSPSQYLAQILLDNLNKAFHLPPNAGKTLEGPWASLVGARMPAVMVEIGYLTNPTEGNYLNDNIYCQAIAEALAIGIEEYYKNPFNPRY